MIGAVVVTHGQLGHELVASAEMIVGEVRFIREVSIGWNDDVNDSRRDIENAIRQVDQGKGVLVLTDMFGGTPSNIAFSFLNSGRVEIVTGVNLPMIIKFASQTGDEALSELARMVRDQGQKNISLASEFLNDSKSSEG